MIKLITRRSRRWDTALAEVLRMHRETSARLQETGLSETTWARLCGRLEALEDAQDALLFARRGLAAPEVRRQRSRVGAS